MIMLSVSQRLNLPLRRDLGDNSRNHAVERSILPYFRPLLLDQLASWKYPRAGWRCEAVSRVPLGRDRKNLRRSVISCEVAHPPMTNLAPWTDQFASTTFSTPDLFAAHAHP